MQSPRVAESVVTVPGIEGTWSSECFGSFKLELVIFFCCERLSASMARSLQLSFICIPQSARALDQGGVEPRQAGTLEPEPGLQLVTTNSLFFLLAGQLVHVTWSCSFIIG